MNRDIYLVNLPQTGNTFYFPIAFCFPIHIFGFSVKRAYSSAWLERTPDKREVPGSTPGRPTSFIGDCRLGIADWKTPQSAIRNPQSFYRVCSSG